MKRTTILVLTLLSLASMSAFVVLADNPHYTVGPFFVDNGYTATATGKMAGLGNGNVIVTLSFPNAVGTTTCSNPSGKQAPGQNPATPVPVSGTQLIPRTKNGTVSFTVTTDVPDDPTPQSAGCPNGNWSAAFNNITFGNGTLTVQQETFQGSGVYVLVLTTPVSLP